MLIKIFSNDYECFSAENGNEALDILKKEIALVLLDLVMPVMDGYELITAMRADQRLVSDSNCCHYWCY